MYLYNGDMNGVVFVLYFVVYVASLSERDMQSGGSRWLTAVKRWYRLVAVGFHSRVL